MINNDNPDKATQTDFNLASSSSSFVVEDVRTPEEAVKESSYDESSVKFSEKPVSEEKQKTGEGTSLLRRMFDSMFEETEVDVPRSRQVSVATEQSEASSSSLRLRPNEATASMPMNVKKSYEPSPASSTNRSVLLPVARNTLTPQVSPDVIPSSAPSNRSVENVQSPSAPSESTIEYSQSSEQSDRTIECIEPSPPASVVSSRRSQQTIEHIHSRSSSGRSR